MKYPSFIAGLISLLVILPVVAGDEAEGLQLETAPYAVGQIVTLQSEILDEERVFLVHLPAGYERSTRVYPVLYVLDGRGNFVHTVGSVGVLTRANQIPDLIVVAIANVNRNRDFTAIDRAGDGSRGGSGKFLSFLEKEVVPLIDDSFRIAAKIGERTAHPAILIFKANLDRVEKLLEQRQDSRENSEGIDRSLSP